MEQINTFKYLTYVYVQNEYVPQNYCAFLDFTQCPEF